MQKIGVTAMSERLSLRAAGRLVGCDHAYLARLVKNGRLPRGTDKLVEVAAVRAILAQADPALRRKESTSKGGDPVVTGHQSPPAAVTTDEQAKDAVALIGRVLQQEGIVPDGAVDFPMARLAETILKARQRDLVIAERRKKLVALDAVKQHVEKAFTGYRQAVQRMPSRYAAQMAAHLGCDSAALTGELDRMISETLAELSAPAVR